MALWGGKPLTVHVDSCKWPRSLVAHNPPIFSTRLAASTEAHGRFPLQHLLYTQKDQAKVWSKEFSYLVCSSSPMIKSFLHFCSRKTLQTKQWITTYIRCIQNPNATLSWKKTPLQQHKLSQIWAWPLPYLNVMHMSAECGEEWVQQGKLYKRSRVLGFRVWYQKQRRSFTCTLGCNFATSHLQVLSYNKHLHQIQKKTS